MENGDLRVWHIPQIPGKPFEVPVRTPEEGWRLIETLALYDAFQLAHKIKSDYSNASGLSVFRDGEWADWYDDETGSDLDEMASEEGWILFDKEYQAAIWQGVHRVEKSRRFVKA